jgi:flagellar biosynthesis protein FliR
MNLPQTAIALLRVLPCLALVPLRAGALTWGIRVVIAATLVVAIGIAPGTSSEVPLLLAAVRELTAGVSLALVLALPLLALRQASSLLCTADPNQKPVARFVNTAGILVFLSAKGHHGVLLALAASWRVFPYGQPLPETSLATCVLATAESLAGAMLIASSGFLALIALELSTMLVSHFAWPLTRSAVAPLRMLVVTATVTITLHVSAEVTLDMARRAFSLAAK